jgi:membrane protease subunit (stomatin/prohibitin family)
MGFRFRKSFKIAPGIRLNLSKSGIGASVGVKGFRVTKRADGRIQRTTSLPGTGISYVTTSSGASSDNSAEPSETMPTRRTRKATTCPACGHRYTIGKANFCSQCGQSLVA